MKISLLEIQNIKSIGEKIQLYFERGINIFIGPNGSGKSNVMDILNTILHTYFIWHWHENIEPYKIIYQKQNLEGFFDLSRHFDLGNTKSQEVSIEIEFSDDDLGNIKIIRDYFSEIVQTEKDLLKLQTSEIENIFSPFLTQVTQENLRANCKQKFTFNAQKLDQNSGDLWFEKCSDNNQKFWFRYLNCLEKVKYLIEKYNKNRADSDKIKELKFNFKFFSSNRFHEGQQFEISLPGQNRTQKYKENKQKTVRAASSDIDFSTFCFS